MSIGRCSNSKRTPQTTRFRCSVIARGSCGLHVLHGVYKTAQSVTPWKLDRFLNCFSIFKKSLARRSAYLTCNDLFVSHEVKDTSYVFPLKYCEHRQFENGKIGRIIEILPQINQLKELKEKKAFPENDDRLALVYQMVNSHLLLPILKFSKSIMNVLELFLSLFQAERLLTLFLLEHLKRLITSQMDYFVHPSVLESASSTKKLMVDLSNRENLLLMKVLMQALEQPIHSRN